MALTDYQYLEIEKYVSGKMTPDEEAVFFSEVAADEEWQTEFEYQKMLHGKQDIYEELPAFLRETDRDSINYKKNKAIVAAIAASANPFQNAEKPTRVVSLFRSRWLIAASVFGLVLLSGLIFYNRSSKPGQDVADKKETKAGTTIENGDSSLIFAYLQNYQTYQPGDNIPPDISNAVVSYKLQNYQLAATEFSETVTTRGSSNQKKIEAYSKFYKGLCMLELNKPDEAYSLLKNAFANKEKAPEISLEIEWYYALVCLKQGRKDEAVTVLKVISTGNNSRYKDKAAVVLQQLK